MNNIRALMNYEAALVRAKKERTVSKALAIMSEWAHSEFKDRRRKVTDEMVARIRQMNEEDQSVRTIAGTLELSEPTVRRVLERAAGGRES